MKHLILVGACYLDTILSVPHYPEEDSKLRATTLEVRRGGNCPNTAEVLQELLRNSSTTSEARDLQPWLVSSLPAAESPGALKIISSFGDGAVVRLDHCMYRDGCTEAASSYIIRSQKTGSRTIVNYNGLPEMTVGEFAAVVDAFAGEQETWWHFEVRSFPLLQIASRPPVRHPSFLTFAFPRVGSDSRDDTGMHPPSSTIIALGQGQCRGGETKEGRPARTSRRGRCCVLLQELGRGQ
ncbi:uncharacterized protein E0L32_012256 [Thyridium curvatum]|uniref:Ketohexokinase n=1 Tax=Thyridium curvatum TaxID=1093900 RepID=A0A507BDB1_9PEZI|nr:uncharacterized protein E0L32_012256 [Thyridium curvatum]TPX17266.1 hypothetical protein E0L32_012256 [Thyridium curvatum]